MAPPHFYSTDTKDIVVLYESILRLNGPYACALMSSTPDEEGGALMILELGTTVPAPAMARR